MRSSNESSSTDIRGGELAFEVLHRSGPDDRRGDRGVVGHERDCDLDKRDADLIGELRELLRGVELALIARQRKVVAPWEYRGTG